MICPQGIALKLELKFNDPLSRQFDLTRIRLAIRPPRQHAGPGPPGGLVTVPMDFAVVQAANRHGKLIAHLAPDAVDSPKNCLDLIYD